MFITQLFENPQEPSIVVIYAGRFQPFHKGHHAVFNWLSGKYGRNNVFIATSNKTEPLKSPFSFQEKAYFMQLTGIPGDRVVETVQPYRADEITKNYDPRSTLLLFAVSEKDMAEDPRFKVGSKKDGSPSYFQHLPSNLRDTKTFSEHAYLVVAPKFDFTVLGQPVDSASQIRAMYSQSDDAARKQIITDLFGNYTNEAQHIMDNKLGATPSQDTPSSPKVGKMYEGEELDPRAANLIQRARAMHPLAQSDDQALAMYALDKEQDDVAELGQEESDIEAEIAAMKLDIAKLKAKSDISEDAAGVGLVRNSNDPRYVMATMGDQNDVNSKTLGKMMKAYNLVSKATPKTGQTQVKRNIAESYEETVSPVENAILRRIMQQRLDLLSTYGPADIMAAAKEVAEFVGDVDEIGSSDVSGWVRHVEQMLGNMQDEPREETLEDKLRAQLDELSPDTLKSYRDKGDKDIKKRYNEPGTDQSNKKLANRLKGWGQASARLGEDDWHGEGELWHGTGDAWHGAGSDGAATSDFGGPGGEEVVNEAASIEQLQQALQILSKFAPITAQLSRDCKAEFGEVEAQLNGLTQYIDSTGLGQLATDINYAVKDAIQSVNQALSAVYGVQQEVNDTVKRIQLDIDDIEFNANWKD